MSIDVTDVRSIWGVTGDNIYSTTDGEYITYDATKPQYIYIPE